MILELFAGYGGLGMAVSALTGATVGYVSEVDEAACTVLATRFPDADAPNPALAGPARTALIKRTLTSREIRTRLRIGRAPFHKKG